jgi:iron(III) transport system ATP-binding protein
MKNREPRAPQDRAWALRCTGLAKRFRDLEVVQNLHLAAQMGQIVALLGPSGCGKTTTLRMIAGLEVADWGIIEIDGRVVARPGLHESPERRSIGMVFQDYALFPHLSVSQNVGFGLSRGSRPKGRIDDVLDLVGLRGYGNRMPHELSGGQQQRVALARALAPGPDLLLLDEPFSNLDPELRVSVRRDVHEILVAAGATTILVTHDQEEALSLADSVAVMSDGHIVQHASPEDLYHKPATRMVASFVGTAQFLPGHADGWTVTTELGQHQLAEPIEGTVDVLVRPEMLELGAGFRTSDAKATVTAREFHGAYLNATIRLASGRTLVARTHPFARFAPGDLVDVRIGYPAVAFPALPGDSIA